MQNKAYCCNICLNPIETIRDPATKQQVFIGRSVAYRGSDNLPARYPHGDAPLIDVSPDFASIHICPGCEARLCVYFNDPSRKSIDQMIDELTRKRDEQAVEEAGGEFIQC